MVGDPREDDADPPEDESTLPISQLSPSCHWDPRLDERLQRLEKSEYTKASSLNGQTLQKLVLNIK